MKFVDFGAVVVGGALLITSNGASGIRGSDFAAPGPATHEEDPPGRLFRGHAAISGNEEERFVNFTVIGFYLSLLKEFLVAYKARIHGLEPVMDLPQEFGFLREYNGVSNRRPSPPDDNVVPPSTGQEIEQFIALKKAVGTYMSKNPSATVAEQN
uniref:RxLR effector candidate protein n=1 Tax=Hyaloperonospora arabidopsidis (strain Emoy2) TaxID=559515 RepID=M4C4Q0_HYAAE